MKRSTGTLRFLSNPIQLHYRREGFLYNLRQIKYLNLIDYAFKKNHCYYVFDQYAYFF